MKRINIFNWGPSRASHSTFLQRTSIRCFFRALARAPTSFIGFAPAHLLHLRKSKNLLESTLIWSDVSFNPQLNDSLVVPSANRWTTCVLRCLYMWKSGFQTSFSSIGSYTSSGYSSKVAASLDKSVELLSLGFLLEGSSSTVGSVIMPDLDASGKKDPVRMRWRTNSSCLIGSG